MARPRQTLVLVWRSDIECRRLHYERIKASVARMIRDKAWHAADPLKEIRHMLPKPNIAVNCHLQRRYCMTEQDYISKCKAQNECCALCNERAQLYVDHDHKTGKFRGLICNDCNLAIGKVKENVETLKAMIEYLEANCESSN